MNKNNSKGIEEVIKLSGYNEYQVVDLDAETKAIYFIMDGWTSVKAIPSTTGEKLLVNDEEAMTIAQLEIELESTQLMVQDDAGASVGTDFEGYKAVMDTIIDELVDAGNNVSTADYSDGGGFVKIGFNDGFEMKFVMQPNDYKVSIYTYKDEVINGQYNQTREADKYVVPNKKVLKDIIALAEMNHSGINAEHTVEPTE